MEGGASEEWAVPDAVKHWVLSCYKHLVESDTHELASAYDSQFHKLTERYFRASRWPAPALIKPLVPVDAAKTDASFMLLYTQLYFRHVYANRDLKLTVPDLMASWDNFTKLFDLLLEKDKKFELPLQWLWDIVEDFIDQFAYFHQNRGPLSSRSEENAKNFADHIKSWSFPAVVQILESIVTKGGLELAKIDSIASVAAPSADADSKAEIADDADDDGRTTAESSSLYALSTPKELFAAYALVGLSRIYTLIGDFATSIACLTKLPIRRNSSLTRFLPVYVSIHYFLGISYLMTRRFVDSFKTFGNILSHTARYKRRGMKGSFDTTSDFIEKMYALLTISYGLCPQRIEESLLSSIRDNYDDQLQAIQTPNYQQAFSGLFQSGMPKFLAPILKVEGCAEAFTAKNDYILKLFLQEIIQRQELSSLTDFLKLYTTIFVSKLSDTMEVSKGDLVPKVLSVKHLTHNLRWKGGPAASGVVESSLNIDFYIEGDVVHAAEVKAARRFGDYFLRQIQKFEDLSNEIGRL